MVSAASNTFIRTYMYERKTLQFSKYKKRETIHVFKCLKCENELHLRKYDLKKCSGYCRKCSDNNSAKTRGMRHRKRPYEALFNVFKRRTLKHKKTNTFTFEQFVNVIKNNKNCHYCKSEVYWTEHNISKNGESYNLDRKNNALGYDLENCVVCCWKCNESKKDNYSYDEWYLMTKHFRK